MTAALALLVGAAVLATCGSRVLRTAGWASRAPHLALLVWQAVSLSTVTSVLLGLGILALPVAPALPTAMAGWLGACLGLLEEQYGMHSPGAVSWIALGVLGTVVLRLLACVGVEVWIARRERAAARARTILMARPERRGRAVVLDDPRSVAYCVPGRRPIIVMSSGALDSLSHAERAAVLAHEQAHLRYRHHWAITWSVSVARAFPFVPTLRRAVHEVPLLVELHADDVAVRRSDRRVLASALVRMAESLAPAASLGVGGSGALVRVRRLLGSQPLMRRWERAALAGGTAVVAIAPVLVALAPGLGSLIQAACAPFQHLCDVPGSSDVPLS